MTISNMSIVQANADHSTFLAKVVLAASRSQLKGGPFDIALGIEEGEILDVLEWMTLSDFVSNCHYSKFLVAEVDGEPIGALAAYDPAERDLVPMGAALADAYVGLGYDEAELPDVMARVEAVNSCIPPARPGSWTIEWVAVEKHFRGLGVCGRLLDKISVIGAARGLGTAQVSTYLGNDQALSAYKSAGFEVETKRRDKKFEALLGVPGIVTMRRELRQQSSLSSLATKDRIKLMIHASYPLSTVPIPW